MAMGMDMGNMMTMVTITTRITMSMMNTITKVENTKVGIMMKMATVDLPFLTLLSNAYKLSWQLLKTCSLNKMIALLKKTCTCISLLREVAKLQSRIELAMVLRSLTLKVFNLEITSE